MVLLRAMAFERIFVGLEVVLRMEGGCKEVEIEDLHPQQSYHCQG
jgi:hypothetical protein